MIITKKKPLEDVLLPLEGVRKVALVGCASCAASCGTGGEKDVLAMREALEAAGKEVVAAVVPDECCHKLLVKRDVKGIRTGGAEAVVCMACGDGVQTVAANLDLPVFPANDTLFLGMVERVGIFHEACKMCGDCILGYTGGICPVTQCAKSLTNGPCGGAKDGKCEIDPSNDCAWQLIYRRLEKLGRLDLLSLELPDKSYENAAYPRTVNNREAKK